jgi:uncharacterized protein (TIGR00661 family)
MGYGRGHAMRVAAVLPTLMREHDVTVFAGEDAYDALASRFPTVRIPLVRYHYDERGQLSLRRTILRNLAPAHDLLMRGAGARAVEREFRRRRIQLVISDSEAWTHRAAERLRLPRIGFDHIGVIPYCKPHFPRELAAAGLRDALVYRSLMGEPDRILISSFYPAVPRDAKTRVVGPVLRRRVLRTRPHDGEHLLAYFNKGHHQYRAALDRALRAIRRRIIVYGTPRRGVDGNLDFRAPDDAQFVRDLAGSRAVISTAGNQLLSEAIYLRKPILALPEDAFEQRLNASMIERMGVGEAASLRHLSPVTIEQFLQRHAYYSSHMDQHANDGRSEAIRTLQRFIGELRG